MTVHQIMLAYAVGGITAVLAVLGIRFGMWWGDRFG